MQARCRLAKRRGRELFNSPASNANNREVLGKKRGKKREGKRGGRGGPFKIESRVGKEDGGGKSWKEGAFRALDGVGHRQKN